MWRHERTIPWNSYISGWKVCETDTKSVLASCLLAALSIKLSSSSVTVVKRERFYLFSVQTSGIIADEGGQDSRRQLRYHWLHHIPANLQFSVANSGSIVSSTFNLPPPLQLPLHGIALSLFKDNYLLFGIIWQLDCRLADALCFPKENLCTNTPVC